MHRPRRSAVSPDRKPKRAISQLDREIDRLEIRLFAQLDVIRQQFVTDPELHKRFHALRRKYDPSQPRVPAGEPEGGQWVGDNHRVTGSAKPKPAAKPKVVGQKPSTAKPTDSPFAPAGGPKPRQDLLTQPALLGNSRDDGPEAILASYNPLLKLDGVPSADRSAIPAPKFNGQTIRDPVTNAQPDLPKDAVPLLLPDGTQVYNPFSRPGANTPQYVYYPAGLPPALFIQEGERSASFYQGLLNDPAAGPLAASGFLVGALERFSTGNAWDAQRLDGTFKSAYIDYGTIDIGLWAAAAGVPIEDILQIQNGFAYLFSKFPVGVQMDAIYTNLPARNVYNTEFGYNLYKMLSR